MATITKTVTTTTTTIVEKSETTLLNEMIDESISAVIQEAVSHFNKEKKYRLKNNLPLHPIDINFAKNSSKLGLISGVGLGIDRFLKLL